MSPCSKPASCAGLPSSTWWDDRATLALAPDRPYAKPTHLIRGEITHPTPTQIQQTESPGLLIVSHPEDHSNLIIPVEFTGGLFLPIPAHRNTGRTTLAIRSHSYF